MAPRWIRTKDYSDTVFEPAQSEDDWLLLSGEFVIGRVLRDRSGPQAGRFAWSLTGPQGGPTSNYGMAGTFEEAQGELLTAWRRWQMWAEVRDAQ